MALRRLIKISYKLKLLSENRIITFWLVFTYFTHWPVFFTAYPKENITKNVNCIKILIPKEIGNRNGYQSDVFGHSDCAKNNENPANKTT